MSERESGINCPDCGNGLKRVIQESPKMYNDYQFAAMICGDLFCTVCTSGRATSGHKYFWEDSIIDNG